MKTAGMESNITILRPTQAAAFIFRSQAKKDTQTIKLRGLNASKCDIVECIDGSTAADTRTGKELMENGLMLGIAEEDGSDVILLSATP